MSKEQKTSHPPNRRVLEAIASALEEIEAHLGFGDGEADPPKATTSVESDVDDIEQEDDDEMLGYGDSDYFDREEVEVAIDGFISSLIDDGILKKRKSGKLPSFADVFEKFLGKDHEISEKARKFEEYVKGYFGAIDSDDMDAAHNQFLAIRDLVKEKLKETSNGAQ